MSNTANYVNIESLPRITEAAPGDYFVVYTPEGQALIDYQDLPFTAVSGNDVTVLGVLSSSAMTIVTNVTASSAYFSTIYIDGVSGINIDGNYNTFEIKSGVITNAYNTVSQYTQSLSATVDSQIYELSSQIPKIFADGGVTLIDGTNAAPAYSEVIVGNYDVPENLFISPNDINLKFLYNSQLNNFLQSNLLSSMPMIFIEENVSNSYVNSNKKIQFRAIFRPAMRTGARIAWNINKVYY
jgi:hypothetical protein